MRQSDQDSPFPRGVEGIVTVSSFPASLGLSSEQTEEVVRLAGAAPSLHNSQPWRFRVLPQVIELHSDPERRLPVADPEGRELRLACGAALLNLRLALEHAGVRPMVALLPSLTGQSAVAEVRAGGRANPSAEEEKLYRAIPERRSNRHPFLSKPVATEHRHALLEAVRVEQCWLHVVESSERGPLEGLVHRAHRAQMADKRFRAEAARWTGRPDDAAEGVPTSAAGPAREAQDQWVLRDFSGGQSGSRAPGKDFETDPLLVVVCSHHAVRLEDLQAGQALQRMWLTATSLGLAASLISQVIEVRETKEELRRLLGGTLHPQALLRVGHGSPSPAVPRRAPEELLMQE